MNYKTIIEYFAFLQAHKFTYFSFSKQLIIGELAGFLAGVAVAEAIITYTKNDDVTVSVFSTAADYVASTLGFLAVYHQDNKNKYNTSSSRKRLKWTMKSAVALWPSIAAADVVYIFSRHYLHYYLMISGIEAGIAATIAHFSAFIFFNLVAILSRSLIEYVRFVYNK